MTHYIIPDNIFKDEEKLLQSYNNTSKLKSVVFEKCNKNKNKNQNFNNNNNNNNNNTNNTNNTTKNKFSFENNRGCPVSCHGGIKAPQLNSGIVSLIMVNTQNNYFPFLFNFPKMLIHYE